MGVAKRIPTKTLSDDLSGEQRMPSVFSAKRFRVACAIVLAGLCLVAPYDKAADLNAMYVLADAHGLECAPHNWGNVPDISVPRYFEIIMVLSLVLTGVILGQVIRRVRRLADFYAERMEQARGEPR